MTTTTSSVPLAEPLVKPSVLGTCVGGGDLFARNEGRVY